MFYRFLFVFLFLCPNLFFAQHMYFVYFKDKGISAPNRFYKTSAITSLCTQELSEKSIERRKKVLGEENFVNYDDIPVYKPYIQQLIRSGITVDKVLKWFNSVSCYLNSEQYNEVKSFSFVEKIEPVRSLKVQRSSNKPVFNFAQIASDNHGNIFSGFDYGNSLAQNSLSEIPEVHEAGFSGRGVIIGVLDSGFELTSRSLAGRNILAQHDFVFNDEVTANEPADTITQHNHGTAVLSIIGGMDQGNLIGPAYGASYLLAKTEDVRTEKNIEEDNYAAALIWMERMGVQITTSSLGYFVFDEGDSSYTYQDMNGLTAISTIAAEKAFGFGVVVLSAAGNEGASSWKHIIAPADGINTIAVGAVSPTNGVAYFSSRGPSSDGRIKPDIAAQGTEVFHAMPLSQNYFSGGGTSYATPIAAGVAALLMQAYPHLTNVQVRSILHQAGDNFRTPNTERGYGLVSAVRALNFPNLKNNSTVCELNKMFIGKTGIIDNSVKLNYSVNSVPQSQLSFSRIANNIYTITLPILNAGDEVIFNISYSTPSGTETEPVNEFYKFNYGELIIENTSFRITEISPERIPNDYMLCQNYPNPFNPVTTIQYTVVETPYMASQRVTMKVYDFLGREIATLVNGVKSPGVHSVQFDAHDLPSGIYFYRLQAGKNISTKKMVLIK